MASQSSGPGDLLDGDKGPGKLKPVSRNGSSAPGRMIEP
jgi:hypothetical protein